MAGDHLPDAVDVRSPSWTVQAHASLREFGFARLRLTAPDASCARDLYAATDAFFDDRKATDKLEIPKDQFDDLDTRSGYVYGRDREMFELHDGCPSAAALPKDATTTSSCRFVRCYEEYVGMCQELCRIFLLEIARGDKASCLRTLLGGEGNPPPAHLVDLDAGLFGDCVRIYRYAETYDKPDGDIDAHYDMGLLSIIPKSSSSGLKIKPPKSTKYVTIEDFMEPDEAVIFGGMTLARLSDIPALKHGVFTNGKERFSAPFFQRVALGRILPSSHVSPQEAVDRFNRRLRDAHNHELRSDGTIERDSRSRSRNRSRSRGRRHSDKRKRADDLDDVFAFGKVRGAVNGCRGHSVGH